MELWWVEDHVKKMREFFLMLNENVCSVCISSQCTEYLFKKIPEYI